MGMNAKKLATMPYPRVKGACLIHAERALFYRMEGNMRLFAAHVDLLNQCAVVGRRKRRALIAAGLPLPA